MRASALGGRIAAGAFAGVIAATLAIGALAPPAWGAAIIAHGPSCPFRSATGVDCPFCGMTRATVALGSGRWRDALVLHPLAPLVLAGMLVLCALIVLGRGELLVHGRRPQLLLAAIIAVWILRLIL